MKQGISIFLVLALLFGILPGNVLAADASQDGSTLPEESPVIDENTQYAAIIANSGTVKEQNGNKSYYVDGYMWAGTGNQVPTNEAGYALSTLGRTVLVTYEEIEAPLIDADKMCVPVLQANTLEGSYEIGPETTELAGMPITDQTLIMIPFRVCANRTDYLTYGNLNGNAYIPLNRRIVLENVQYFTDSDGNLTCIYGEGRHGEKDHRLEASTDYQKVAVHETVTVSFFAYDGDQEIDASKLAFGLCEFAGDGYEINSQNIEMTTSGATVSASSSKTGMFGIQATYSPDCGCAPLTKMVHVEVTPGRSLIINDPGSVSVGDVVQLSAQMSDGSACLPKWSVSDPSVASVTEDGKLTAVTTGMVTVKAYTAIDNYEYIADFVLAVGSVPDRTLLLSGPEQISVGQTATIHAKLSDGSTCILTWIVSDSNIASISDAGVLTAKNPGMTTVTVTAQTEDGQIYSTSVLITVTGAYVYAVLMPDSLTYDGKEKYTAELLQFGHSTPEVCAIDRWTYDKWSGISEPQLLQFRDENGTLCYCNSVWGFAGTWLLGPESLGVNKMQCTEKTQFLIRQYDGKTESYRYHASTGLDREWNLTNIQVVEEAGLITHLYGEVAPPAQIRCNTNFSFNKSSSATYTVAPTLKYSGAIQDVTFSFEGPNILQQDGKTCTLSRNNSGIFDLTIRVTEFTTADGTIIDPKEIPPLTVQYSVYGGNSLTATLQPDVDEFEWVDKGIFSSLVINNRELDTSFYNCFLKEMGLPVDADIVINNTVSNNSGELLLDGKPYTGEMIQLGSALKRLSFRKTNTDADLSQFRIEVWKNNMRIHHVDLTIYTAPTLTMWTRFGKHQPVYPLARFCTLFEELTGGELSYLQFQPPHFMDGTLYWGTERSTPVTADMKVEAPGTNETTDIDATYLNFAPKDPYLLYNSNCVEIPFTATGTDGKNLNGLLLVRVHKPQLSVISARTIAGGTVEIPVYLHDHPGFAGINLINSFDADVLTLTKIEKGNILTSESGYLQASASTGRLAWVDSVNTHAQGELYVLHFKVAENAKPGKYLVDARLLDHDTTNFVTADGIGIPLDHYAGTITVVDPLVGDISSDNRVTVLDAVYLARYLVEDYEFDSVQLAAADINGDGAVDSADALILARRLVGLPDQAPVLFSVLPDPGREPALKTASIDAEAGQTVTVPVTLENNSGVAAFALQIDYDHSVLALEDIARGGVLQNAGGSFQKNAEAGLVSWTNVDGTTEAGELLLLTFHVLENTVGGSSEISVHQKGGVENNFLNPAVQAVQLMLSSGGVTVLEEPPVSKPEETPKEDPEEHEPPKDETPETDAPVQDAPAGNAPIRQPSAAAGDSTQENAPDLPFADVKDSDWFHASVQYVYENGIMNGLDQTTFVPNGQLTRAMVVQVLYNLEGKPAAEQSEFRDVASGAWYHDAVTWAAEQQIVNGYGEGVFGPMDPVTREQFATILFRYHAWKGAEAVNPAEHLNGFADGEQVSAFAVSAMNWAVDRGILTGKTETRLDPRGTATRAEAAAMLMRFLVGQS